MDILNFLYDSKIFDSKGNARKAIKNNAISIDFKKITDDKFDVPILLEEGDSLKGVDASDWFDTMYSVHRTWNERHFTSELLLFTLMKDIKTLNVKGLNDFVDHILRDVFVVKNGRKKIYIVTIKYKDE